jgi:hypothetical protein
LVYLFRIVKKKSSPKIKVTAFLNTKRAAACAANMITTPVGYREPLARQTSFRGSCGSDACGEKTVWISMDWK